MIAVNASLVAADPADPPARNVPNCRARDVAGSPCEEVAATLLFVGQGDKQNVATMALPGFFLGLSSETRRQWGDLAALALRRSSA